MSDKRSPDRASQEQTAKQRKSSRRRFAFGRFSTNDGYPTVFRPQIGAFGDRSDSKRGLFALILAAIATLIVANSAPMDAVVRQLQSEPAMAAAAVPRDPSVEFASFLPIFGPEAVAACNQRCAVGGLSGCERSCKKLSLVEYPKHLDLSQARIESDAKNILGSCSLLAAPGKEFTQLSDWRKNAVSAMSILRSANKTPIRDDFATARLFYSDLGRIISNLRRPPAAHSGDKESQLTEKIVRTSCVRANYTLTELALVLAQQDNIEPDIHYYNELSRLLRRPIADAEVALFKESDALLPRK